jgi:hypothetical protein
MANVLMDELACSLAAMDTALTKLKLAIDRSCGDSDDLPNLVALLAMNVRAQHAALRAMVDRIDAS